MATDKAMTKEERDRLSNECAAKLLQEGDIDGAAKIFEQMMSPECKAILHGHRTPHFGNGLLPDDDW